MQHEAAVNLHRAAVVYRGQFADLQWVGNVDLFEQRVQRHVDRAIDHHAQRPLLVVLADKRQRFREMRISHGRHGDEKMPREIDRLHGPLRYRRQNAGVNTISSVNSSSRPSSMAKVHTQV